MNIKFKCLSILPFGGLDKYKDKKYVRVKIYVSSKKYNRY